MEELSRLLATRGINFDAVDRRIICFPHMLNTCSKHVTQDYTKADFSAVGEAWVDALGNTIDKAAYIEALRRDPIAFGRDIVRVVRASSLRRESFHNTVTTGNQMNWFTDDDGEPTQLPIIELLRDVKSRWDSIYFMINRLRTLRQVS
jgi:hypothetical protein